MPPETIRDLLLLLDGGDRQAALDAAHTMRQHNEGNKSARGHIVRVYTDIVMGLCEIWLSGPSQEATDMFERADREAIAIHNERLALLASWYEACCRLMRQANTASTYTNDSVWNLLSIQFGMVGARAYRLRDNVHHLLALTLAGECQGKMSWQPTGFASGTAQLLQACAAVKRSADGQDPRIAECIRLLEGWSASPGIPHQTQDYKLFLYKKGELLATVK